MKRIIFLLTFVMTVLSGCAQQQYGDFVEEQSGPLYHAIARDVVRHLKDKYLIGEEGFQVDPEILGALGIEIDLALRQEGYAISTTNGVPLSYVFDQVETDSGEIYRLSLYIGNSRHNRAYMVNEAGNAISHSPWTVIYPEPEQGGIEVLAQGGPR
ncbi:hypothetical protein [Microbulbifer aggregans]|uniref:hypothetical protein n=1 Tax=Microbulbifer aggregans TaxID=1769779 RepID=UPI001CFCD1A5|nr:hypothetical protein [Microbulbifer aggregans]